MPTCPSCHTEFRQRKDGGCPACGMALQIWKGHAFREELGSPNVALLVHFEHLVSDRTSKKQNKMVIFQVPRKTGRYQRELIEAERLLAQCDYDYDLAKEAVSTLFTNRQFYRNYTSLMGIIGDFTLALSIVNADRVTREAVDARQVGIFEQVMNRDNLF